MKSDRQDKGDSSGRDDALIDNARRQVGQIAGFYSGEEPGGGGNPRTTTRGGSVIDSKMARYFPEIEGYRILGILGHGGMGIVYRAEQIALHRTVALKVLPAIVSTVSPSAVTRFRREANAAARLHHTNIVPIYDFGESNDTYYFAMELIAGLPLNVIIPQLAENNVASLSPARFASWLQIQLVGGPDDSDDSMQNVSSVYSDSTQGSSTAGRGRAYFHHVARWMADVADALHYAHERQIIHRDIKPGNLILSPDFRIMIADFGLAKVAGDESFTQTGTLVGTLRYLSPEQAMAKRIKVDGRTDIYSVGATLYELLCFQPAFQGHDEKEILGAIIVRDPAPPQRLNSLVPPELSTICLKCMEKLPDSRYATGKELADDLRRFLNDLPIVAKRPGPIRRARKFLRRHRAVSIAVVAGLVLTGSASLVLYSEKQREARVAREHLDSAELVGIGERSGKQGAWDQAEAEFLEAIRLNPLNVDAWGNLAILKKNKYNYQPAPDRGVLVDALHDCVRAISIDPDYAELPKLWNVKGVILKKLERYEEATSAFEQALEIDSDHGQAYENLGIVQALLRDLSSAEENLVRATRIAETDEEECEFPWRNLVSLELHLGQTEAFDHVENAIKCNNKDPDSWLFRARTYLEIPEHRDIEEALRYAQGADILADRESAKIKRTLALAHLHKEQFESAIAESKAALELGGFKCVNHLIQAVAHARMGNLEEATQQLASAKEHWPDELRESGAYLPSAPRGVLWFESAKQLFGLQREAQNASADDSGPS